MKSFPQIPEHEILAEVGRSRTGMVYRARWLIVDNRIVALKVLRADAEPDCSARLMREARVMARAAHANIPTLFMVAGDGIHNWYIREFIDGPSLEERVASKSISMIDAIRVLGLIAHAVAHIHKYGAVHRDLTPASILIPPDCAPKLIGFSRVGICTPDDPDNTRSPEIDLQALKAMLDWLLAALGQPCPAWLEPARSATSPQAFAEAVEFFLK